jgi:hypothetical protein
VYCLDVRHSTPQTAYRFYLYMKYTSLDRQPSSYSVVGMGPPHYTICILLFLYFSFSSVSLFLYFFLPLVPPYPLHILVSFSHSLFMYPHIPIFLSPYISFPLTLVLFFFLSALFSLFFSFYNPLFFN